MSGPVRPGSDCRWEDVPVEPYKEEGNTFRDVTRQLLFGRDEGLTSDLRYFEVGPGGHTTLERHEHAHAVVVMRGRGQVLVDPEIREIRPYDLVHVASMTWHQFRAAEEEPLGFLCVADAGRDRPRRPDRSELEDLRRRPEVADFIRV
ncbi:MAG: cupin domain-containing protein [Gemmatimonadota bacterium]